MEGMSSDDSEERKIPRYIHEVKEEARKKMVEASRESSLSRKRQEGAHLLSRTIDTRSK